MKNKILNFLIIILSLNSCSGEFKAKKVMYDVINNSGNELYLICNASKNRDKRYRVLFDFIRENIPNLCSLDSSIVSYTISFYRNTTMTRDYVKHYDTLKGVESLYERCENEYSGSFSYERSRENSKVWIMSYPKEYQDTIYCK